MALAVQAYEEEDPIGSMKIYLATWLLEPAQGRALTKANNRCRLLSYYHTKEKSKEVPGYVKTGRNPKR